MTLLFVLSFAIVLFFPGDALAWGPGVHTAAARFVLANLDLVHPASAAIIAQFPNSYLYGCLSADFFVGKGTRIRPGHSHNWDAAVRLAAAAHNPQLAAHALGYMSHLAADVVAHNCYVPGVMVRTALPAGLAHAYVEAQADSRLTGGHGLKGRITSKSQRMLDRGIVSALDKNRAAYLLRKRMFKGSVALAGLPGWNRSLRFAQKVMPLPDERGGLDRMFDLSLRAVLDVLRRPEDSVLRGFDPIGSLNLSRARRGTAAGIDPRLSSLPELPVLSLKDVA
ncbi:MAG: zinc dependent phospholipase C family protein [Thermodesulfobacteriota bacterium]